MRPLDLLPAIERAVLTSGPSALAVARSVSQLLPPGQSRERYVMDAYETLRAAMYPEPVDLVSQARLAVMAWHCLPMEERE